MIVQLAITIIHDTSCFALSSFEGMFAFEVVTKLVGERQPR
jgi:hypothetical protein